MKKLKNSGFFFFIIWTALIIFYSGQTNAQSDIIDPSGHNNNNNFVVGRVVCVNSSNPSDTTIVTSGKVKLLKVNPPNLDVAVIDSANINSLGYYSFYGIPQGAYYIVAYPNDKVEDFMISFYPSGQLYNTAGKVLLSSGQLRVCNIQSVSMNSVGGGTPVSGEVADSANHSFKLRNSIIIAKSGDEFRGFAMTDNQGNYLISSIMPGNYSLTATRFGYKNQTKISDITAPATVNFYLVRDSLATISVSNNSTIVKNFKLYQNYPNPFNPSTEITFSLEKGMNVKLNVYSLEGKFVKEIVNSFRPAGEYKFKFIAENLSSGVYNYVLETENGQRESRLMVFTK